MEVIEEIVEWNFITVDIISVYMPYDIPDVRERVAVIKETNCRLMRLFFCEEVNF